MIEPQLAQSLPLIISDSSPFENEFGVVRLKYVREHFGTLPRSSDIPMIEDLFVQWHTFDEIMPIRCTYRVDGHMMTVLSIHKSIKRCNDVYVKAIKEKMSVFLNQEPRVFFDRDWGVKKTNALSIVLEYDSTEYTLGEAWFNVGIDFNRFLSNIKKQFGARAISHIRAWQAHDSAMPHIHVIVFFKEFEFSVQPWDDGSFRIHPKQKVKPHGKYCRQAIKEAWKQGFVDIKCIDNMGDTFKDLLKYVTSDLEGGAHTRTNAMAWYFRKQSFGISRDFCKDVWGGSGNIDWVEPSDVDEITKTRSNSNRELIAIEVFPIFPAYYFHKPLVTLFNWDKPPPYLSPNIENFLDNFVLNKCNANVNVRDDGVAVTTYKLRGGEII